ncbi:MAG: SET domain-containing protein [Leptospiraceae bacterium]|nr:SET domain-containing protein [Leptospiraceae bacterium]
MVRTYIEKSSIHGMGLFADEFIPAGAVIWQLMPGFDSIIAETEIQGLPPVVRDYVDRFGYLNPEIKGYVLCADDARFFNHSDEPNTVSLSQEVTVALQDIQKGQELTCNYFEFDATAENHFSREQRMALPQTRSAVAAPLGREAS